MGRHRAGFSLIEVMIAMTILVVAVLATFSGIGKASTASNRANSSSLALDAIQTQMESYQTLPFSTVDDVPLAATSPLLPRQPRPVTPSETPCPHPIRTL